MPAKRRRLLRKPTLMSILKLLGIPAESAMGARNEDVVIYYNDSIDSDNWAAARTLVTAFADKPNVRIIWIVEPRQVAFGLSMTPDDQKKCQDLIKKHFAHLGPPFKVLLAGLLEDRDIEGLDNEDEKKLLKFAVKPPYGPAKDVILHRRLTAWDQATCLRHWTGRPVEVLMDLKSLEKIENPVNLHLHHPEELVARSEDELREREAIMNEKDLEQRVQKLRGWYERCIERVEERDDTRGNSVRELDFDSLCATIKNAKSVRFFGGSSLSLLQRFIEADVADKVKCNLQVGSCDLSVNLFPNQFNVGLNVPAAKYVLDNYQKFAKFTVVPSHTAQAVKYSLVGLKDAGGGKCLEKRMLGFNCREDPIKIATGQVTLEKDYPQKRVPMPDVTAFMCELGPKLLGAKLRPAQLDFEKGVLLFKSDDTRSTGIPMWDLDGSIELDGTKVVQIMGSLSRGNGG